VRLIFDPKLRSARIQPGRVDDGIDT